jgi:hypothetical protein
MKKIAVGIIAVLAVLLAGWWWLVSSGNQFCTANCVQLNGIENLSPSDLSAKIKQMCESMGRHGVPEIQQQTKSSVSAHCPP